MNLGVGGHNPTYNTMFSKFSICFSLVSFRSLNTVNRRISALHSVMSRIDLQPLASFWLQNAMTVWTMKSMSVEKQISRRLEDMYVPPQYYLRTSPLLLTLTTQALEQKEAKKSWKASEQHEPRELWEILGGTPMLSPVTHSSSIPYSSYPVFKKKWKHRDLHFYFCLMSLK